MPRRQFIQTELPFEVCPYQYNRCTNPDKVSCSITAAARKAKDIAAFLKAVKKAPRCKSLGDKLTTAQWENRRVGVQA